jgi:hypothetical protein
MVAPRNINTVQSVFYVGHGGGRIIVTYRMIVESNVIGRQQLVTFKHLRERLGCVKVVILDEIYDVIVPVLPQSMLESPHERPGVPKPRQLNSAKVVEERPKWRRYRSIGD